MGSEILSIYYQQTNYSKVFSNFMSKEIGIVDLDNLFEPESYAKRKLEESPIRKLGKFYAKVNPNGSSISGQSD